MENNFERAVREAFNNGFSIRLDISKEGDTVDLMIRKGDRYYNKIYDPKEFFDDEKFSDFVACFIDSNITSFDSLSHPLLWPSAFNPSTPKDKKDEEED